MVNIIRFLLTMVLSCDISVRGSIFGEFKPNPKTKILNTISIGSTVIDVDSTLGFPETGNLMVEDSVGDLVSIAYTGKSVNQFFNVSGITEQYDKKTNIRLDDESYGMSDSIRVIQSKFVLHQHSKSLN